MAKKLKSRRYNGYRTRSDQASGAGLALRAFYRAISLLQNPRLIVPLLLYFILKVFLFTAYLNSANAPISAFWALFIRDLGGRGLSHYPYHLIIMQKILARLDILLGIFVFTLIQGATIALISTAYKKQTVSVSAGFRRSLRLYPKLVGAALAASVSMLVLVTLPALVLTLTGRQPGGSAIFAGTVLGLIAQACFLYAAPGIVIGKYNTVQAIRESFHLMRGGIDTALILVTIPFIFTLPTMLLELNLELIALRISPDFIIHILVIEEVMHLIASYLIVGGAALVFMRKGSDHVR